MVWVKVDDGLPEHEKVIEAGRHLGPYGAGRVLAVWMVGMAYCNRNLTDGVVREHIIRGWVVYDRRPLDVAEVMALKMPDGSSGLLEKVSGGYRFHDYEHYQPLASKVKEKRQKDRNRKKRRPTAPDSNGNHDGFRAESATDSAGIRSTPDPDPGTPVEDHGALTRARFQQPVENLRVLKAIVWTEAKAGLMAGETAHGDLLERVKVVAARAKIDYTTPEAGEYMRDQLGIAMDRLQRRTA